MPSVPQAWKSQRLLLCPSEGISVARGEGQGRPSQVEILWARLFPWLTGTSLEVLPSPTACLG